MSSTTAETTQPNDDNNSTTTTTTTTSTTNSSRGQNALQRRALQLKRWHELEELEEREGTGRGGGRGRRACVEEREVRTKVQFSAGTLFLSAVAQNDVQECERLLRAHGKELDVNVTTGDGLTALHQMAIDDNAQMCEWLLSRDADVNCRDNEGWTPLHASASCGHLEVVRLLLSRSECDVFAINCDGELARDVCDGELCLEAIEERMKSDLKSRDMQWTTDDDNDDAIPETLLTRLRTRELKAIEEDLDAFVARNPLLSERVVREWLESTRDPTSRATVVHVCAAKGYDECLRRLLEVVSAWTDVDSYVDADGFTALHAAAFWQQMSCFETLLKFGANFDLKTRDSRVVSDLCHENPKVDELIAEAKRAREVEAQRAREEQNRAAERLNGGGGAGSQSPAVAVNASETQRKLNAKRQRESRRPTQGVTKEDIEMALKSTQNATVVDQSNDATQRPTPAVSPPPPMPSSPPPTVTMPTPARHIQTPRAVEQQNGGSSVVAVSVSVPLHPQRRRPKRRSTGIDDIDGDVSSLVVDQPLQSVSPSVGAEEESLSVLDCDSQQKTISSTTTTSPTSSSAAARSRSSSRSSLNDSDGQSAEQTARERSTTPTSAREVEDSRDYKKLYKEVLKENEFLIKKIKEFENNRKSEKEFQDFQREKRQLVRRISELEEEVKSREELLKENLRLKDENSALIRVISKLSK